MHEDVNEPMAPEPQLSSGEVVNSLTGFDEDAIERAFGHTVEYLAENTGTTFLRALVFAVERRTGASDGDALKVAKGLTFGELKARFAGDDDGDPDLPGSKVGEGSGGPEHARTP